ncbi:hypothetical protein [Pseudomonas agarici]|uniref:hypothetical protein n=1 Tax=Pseudomonas agarici TaxID=46677 RepID=UPI0015A4D805|nr:hypothetical protein [Pseudomonas agarici]NWB90229.1 hypothetical protein [Pseudomonas agarici]
MAYRDDDGWFRSGDGQKHETHFHANEKDKENDKIFRELYGARKVDFRGNLLQVIYLVVSFFVFLFCQFLSDGLGYVFLIPAAWGLIVLTKFVNKFTQEQRDTVFMWFLLTGLACLAFYIFYSVKYS